MIYAFIAERCSDLPISTCCRVMGVSPSGFYQRRSQPVTDAELVEAWAANEVFDIWKMSRHAYGSPRVGKELRLGRGVHRSKTTCERLMRACGAVGIHYPNATGAAPAPVTASSVTTWSTGLSIPKVGVPWGGVGSGPPTLQVSSSTTIWSPWSVAGTGERPGDVERPRSAVVLGYLIHRQ